MFRSFVRMLGLGGEMGRTTKIGAKGFSPRLESLDGRVMPSTLHVAAGIDTTPAATRSVETPTPPIRVDIYGGASGGVLGDRAGGLGHSSGGVDIYGGVSGGVLGDRAGMVSLDGGVSGGVIGDVHAFGGLSGGVLASGGAAGGIVGSGHSSGEVDMYGGLAGGVLAGGGSVSSYSGTRSSGEEIPQ